MEGISPRIYCVTGTSRQRHSYKGCPKYSVSMVMALKRRVRQSLFDVRHPCGWLQSARTPPPAFPFLHDQLVKEQTRSLVTTSGPHLKGQTRQRVPFRFEFPAKNRGQEQKCRARLGRRGVSASRQGCFYRTPPLVSTPDEQKVQKSSESPSEGPDDGIKGPFRDGPKSGCLAARPHADRKSGSLAAAPPAS